MGSVPRPPFHPEPDAHDEARELVAYGAWANARVFAAAESLTPEQLRAAAAGSFPSVRGTLGHIVGAEWLWLRRLGGLLRHVVNHSTYHRGQVATQMRQLGATPPSTDLVAYLRLQK